MMEVMRKKQQFRSHMRAILSWLRFDDGADVSEALIPVAKGLEMEVSWFKGGVL